MTTLYEKRGRRYYPVAEERQYDSWPAGSHLVVVQPGCQHYSYNVDPDRAALLAAAVPIREQIIERLVEMQRMRPTRRPVTSAQQAAWHKFQSAMGTDGYAVEYASLRETAEAIAQMLVDQAAAQK